MVETKQISTVTQLNVNGSDISIITSYLKDDLPNIISCLITVDEGNRNMVAYIQGELLVDMKNYPTAIDCYFNSSGELIIVGDDADKYSINSNGDLIYTI